MAGDGKLAKDQRAERLIYYYCRTTFFPFLTTIKEFPSVIRPNQVTYTVSRFPDRRYSTSIYVNSK